MAGPRILVVEDERIVAKSLQQRLERLGYSVTAMVPSALEAIREAETTRPDLILMDIKLRGEMDGIEAAAHIRRPFPIPIIYLTAYADEQTLQRARITEPFGYLLKPVETRELQAAIEMALYRHRMEERVRESEECYRDLFENASDAIVISGLDGTISNLNCAAEQLVGRPREQVIDHHYSLFLVQTSLSQMQERIQQLQVEGDIPFTDEGEILRADGTTVPVETRSRLIRNQQGAPVGIQSIHRNISERQALERQRAEFLVMLTHDIKNPLGVVLGYTEFLLDNAKTRGAANDEDMLQRLQSSALSIHALVANYLDLSRVESGKLTLNKQPLLLNDLLENVGKRHAGEALKQRISIALQQPKQSPIVEGDLSSLERVFSNLLHNALKFTPELGHIEIRSEQKNGEVIVFIVDNGPGITQEEIPTLFEKYARGKTHQREGTGLGLFIVKTLVEAHGGRVEVVSTLGEGSCFIVRLPVIASDEIRVTQETLL